ncbi:MAG: aldo/keto reductase [Gammaproteobacteria bacterium]|nr:aldo/keto reductase [Gammaproteobacteria bacterium]
MLKHRPLGQTGIVVSSIGLGTVKIGRNQGLKYPGRFDIPDDKHVVRLLGEARRLGINLLDTAPAYGESEKRLGELLTNRHDWIICTKVGEEFDQGKSTFDFSSSHVKFSVERSLKRLKTDYLDIVLVHSDGNDEDIINKSDCFDALQNLKERGLIKAYGMSTKTVAGGLLAAENSDVVMVTYNPVEMVDGLVIDHAARFGTGVLIKKGLSSGHLMSLTGDDSDSVEDSVRFIFQKPGVSSIVVGTIDPGHLRENVRDAIEVLSASS